jgi:hypothetical protein
VHNENCGLPFRVRGGYSNDVVVCSMNETTWYNYDTGMARAGRGAFGCSVPLVSSASNALEQR